jgi:hypothetical protein
VARLLAVAAEYHESLPFRFAPGYQQRRVNLTLLFGDRWRILDAGRSGPDSGAQEGATTADDGGGWDVFG